MGPPTNSVVHVAAAIAALHHLVVGTMESFLYDRPPASLKTPSREGRARDFGPDFRDLVGSLVERCEGDGGGEGAVPA